MLAISRIRLPQFLLIACALAACVGPRPQLTVPALPDEIPAAEVVLLESLPEEQSAESQLAEVQLAEEALSAAVELMNQVQSEEFQKPLTSLQAEQAMLAAEPTSLHSDGVESLCREIGAKLGSVSVNDCNRQHLVFADGFSVQQRVLVKKDFLPANAAPVIANNRILVMGGIHGDEYSSVSIMFRWMELLSAQQNTDFHWRFLPLTNPDGLLARNATRQNANGVDLNRNFPSADWNATAIAAWKRTTGSNPRRYPGPDAASEPETQWILRQMEEFDPLVIVSVHAPHDLLDFDGHVEAPRRIGMLQLQQLGVYPGSLGNYGGLDRGIPVITLELPSAGIMPDSREIQSMWVDLQDWLSRRAIDLANAKAVAGD